MRRTEDTKVEAVFNALRYCARAVEHRDRIDAPRDLDPVQLAALDHAVNTHRIATRRDNLPYQMIVEVPSAEMAQAVGRALRPLRSGRAFSGRYAEAAEALGLRNAD